MIEAAAWGTLGASSLLVGAAIAFEVRMRPRTLAMIMAFGSGVLISAVAYELVEEAVRVSANGLIVAAGFAGGALVFFAGDELIDRRAAGGGGGLAIVLGAVLDGIPESVVIGISLIAGGSVSVAVLVAVFLSNVPEAISATADLVEGGWSRRSVTLLWSVVVIASGASALLGFALLQDASGSWIAAIQAFAAGAILTMLADEMIPEAYREAVSSRHRKAVGLATALGFALAAGLSFRT
ncbi:MAG TPA: ZIP family metal transporter [Actinomycetota bacterium]|nr:ZIP family metal transporter [Actinomycetota bacterium]